MVEADDSPVSRHRAGSAVYGLMLLVVVYIGRIQELVPQLNNMMIGKLVTALSVILIATSRRDKPLRFMSNRQVKYVLGILALMLISVPFSMWPGGSLGFITDAHAKTLLFFFLILSAVTTETDIEHLLWAVVCSVALLGTAVLLGARGGRSTASSTYDPNDMAFVLVSLLPIVYYFMRGKKGIAKIALVGVLVIMLLSTIATASRGGVVGFVLVSGIIFVKQGWNVKRALLPLMVIGVVLVYGGSETFWDRMSTMGNLGDDYNISAGGGRMVIWKQGLKMMMQHPLTGVGVNAFTVAESGFHDGMGKWNAAHNSFVQIGAELGLLGLILFVTLVASSIRSIRACRISEDRRPVPDWIIDGTEVAFYGYLVTGFFLSQAYSSILYFLIALTVVVRRLCSHMPDPMVGQRDVA